MKRITSLHSHLVALIAEGQGPDPQIHIFWLYLDCMQILCVVPILCLVLLVATNKGSIWLTTCQLVA